MVFVAICYRAQLESLGCTIFVGLDGLDRQENHHSRLSVICYVPPNGFMENDNVFEIYFLTWKWQTHKLFQWLIRRVGVGKIWFLETFLANWMRFKVYYKSYYILHIIMEIAQWTACVSTKIW